MAGAVGPHQARATQAGVRAKHRWVQKVVVHPAVNHVHPFGATGGAHVDKVVAHKQVLAFNQLHAHLLGQKGVLKVGAVVHAGGEHHHGGVVGGGRATRAQGLEQQIGVVRHRCHPVLAEQLREQAHHHLAVFEHIAHPAGHAQVVFQHVILALALGIGGTHDVDAADVRIHLIRHIHPHHLGAKLRVVQNLFFGDDARSQDVLAVVNVVDEAVQSTHPLRQAFLHLPPFVRGDDARDQVEGNQAFGARTFLVFGAIHGKGDAHTAKNHLCLGPARLHGRVALAV